MKKNKKIRALITKKKASVCFLLETKIRTQNKNKLFKVLPSGWSMVTNHDMAHLGQIGIGWNPTVWNIDVLFLTEQYITVKCMNKGGFEFFATAVYASNRASERIMLWNKIIAHSKSISGPWIMIGDFNSRRSNKEKAGGRSVPDSVLDPFNSMIAATNLFEMPATGKDCFT